MENIINTLKKQKSFRSLGSVSVEDINTAEQTLNLKFSNDYKAYVKEFGIASFEGHEFTGICSFPRLNVITVSEEERSFNPDIPQDWYVIEQTNMDGAVVWQRIDGTVFRSMPGVKPEQIAESLTDYILKS